MSAGPALTSYRHISYMPYVQMVRGALGRERLGSGIQFLLAERSSPPPPHVQQVTGHGGHSSFLTIINRIPGQTHKCDWITPLRPDSGVWTFTIDGESPICTQEYRKQSGISIKYTKPIWKFVLVGLLIDIDNRWPREAIVAAAAAKGCTRCVMYV